MARSIMVDPAKLETASQKMDAQSAEYEKIYNQLFTEVQGMKAAWDGVDNQAFVGQIEGFRDNFQQMEKLLNDYSEFLKLSAKTYRNTQNEVLNAAKRLSN